MESPKSSVSHPLRIDSLAGGKDMGLIGLTFCPGKRQISAYSGSWRRDLDLDLEAIRSFGAEALVTLMEDDELAALSVPAPVLGSRTSAHGIEWHHLPIADTCVPDERFEDLWAYSGPRLRMLLRSGQSVVIHCKGGLGRTGTIAARLLIELGSNPQEAIRAVRKARAGSIENQEQEDYVRSCKPIADDGRCSLAERTLGCLLGGAAGDGFGYAVEFKNLTEIQSEFGPAGIQEAVFTNGKLVVSDDTQMTLFTLEGTLKALSRKTSTLESWVEDIRLAYLDWYATQQSKSPSRPVNQPERLTSWKEMYVRRAPGMTCMSALSSGGKGTVEKPINDSKGCGGAMRNAPIGLFRRCFEPDQIFELGARAAALTHSHPSGYLSAGIVAAIVRFLTEGTDLTTAASKSCEILKTWSKHQETLGITKKALALAGEHRSDHQAAIRELGEGWVGEEALAIALYAALSGETYVDVVRLAANHDGDSDSTASIAGQLFGAWHGLEGIPHAWIVALDVLRPLLHLSRRLIDQMPSARRVSRAD